jgi:hypothetical protein
MSILLLGSFSAVAQTDLSENDRNMLEQRRKEESQRRADIARQQLSRSGERVGIVPSQNRISSVNKPVITKSDIAAISVNQTDEKLFAAFLQQPNTGIVRLQSGDKCSSEGLIVQAEGNCPNNIPSKATAYSFRESDYRSKNLADLFFSTNQFSSTGVFTIGIFVSLGNAEIENLNLTSDGIKQLINFQPSEDKAEINQHYQTFRKGVQVGNYIYKSSVEVKENTSYVLRTIAYKGKVFKGTGAGKINILQNDSRSDVTIIFRVIRKHEDGSLTLLWKKLLEKSSPKIVSRETEKDQSK